MAQQAITVSERYASLVPELSTQEYESLKKSIKEKGLWVPIIVNGKGIVLDGHHRYKACHELGIEPRTLAREFEDELEEELFVIHCNLVRRQLSTFDKVKLALTAKPILEAITKKHMSLAGKGVPIKTPLGRIDVEIGKLAGGVSKNTVRKVETIIEEALPELIEKAKYGKLSIDKAFRTVQKEQLLIECKKKIASCSVENNFSPNMQLINSDFKQVELNESSIDLIFTDPPYEEKWLPNYSDLAVLADKTLAQNGSFVTYCNQTQIPEIIQDIENMGFTYWHTIVVILENTFARNFPRRIVYKYKPLLWFVKGKRAKGSDFISDIIYSKRPDKNLHPWQQSNVEAEHVISRLTTEGQTVLDPLMGSGTTGIAAINLKRKFIGIEIDLERFEMAKVNLSK